MGHRHRRPAGVFGIVGLAIAGAAGLPAFAQAPAAVSTAQDAPQEVVDANTIVVLGEITYRNRTEQTAPTLEYGTDYFQRFEPLSAGDALKRVPSVTFMSDVLESDGVRLRGLDPAYTQILINGEEVPGAGSSSGAFGNGAETSFFVDRIPAELIERVEIVRSASANRSGDALAGAINIVLRDGYSLDGGYVRFGGLLFDDGRVRESFGGVWGGEVASGRLLLGANVQGRRNPKRKFSARFDDVGGTLVDIEDQVDTRNGTDYSANFAWEADVNGGELKLDGFYVQTDRMQDEDSTEFVSFSNLAATARTGPQLFTLNDNDVEIKQESVSLNGSYRWGMLGGRTRVKLGYALFQDDTYEFENEVEYLRGSELPSSGAPAANRIFPEADRFTRDLAPFAIEDNEFKAKIEHDRDLAGMKFEGGVQYERKERDTSVGGGRFRVTLANGTIAQDASGVGIPGYRDPAVSFDMSTITRTNIDPFALLRGESGPVSWEAGLRVETATLEVGQRESDYTIVLPSGHLSWQVAGGRVRASAARTLRNAPFEFLFEGVLEEELGANDFRGNPELEPETAWGGDLGYELPLGRTGIAGVNVFYRAVSDLIEVFNTGEPGSEDDPPDDRAFIYSARNSGDGNVWGVEFDFSSDLSAVGLPDTGLFANFSWLDSDVSDEFGSRRFNSQSEFVYNFGFIHDITAWNAAFGATYRKQGDAFSRVVGEEVTTSYGADLEVFVEKSFGDRFTVRFVGSNLLDASKDEVFRKYALLANQAASAIDDEFELESETAGPVFQLMGRLSF